MTRGTTTRAKVWRVAASLFALGCAAHIEARAGTVLRVAMTAGDIPDWTGQPDQGFEGYRFVGWSLYDALINWDLSRSDREAPLTPGLATRWAIDPANNKRWLIELRKGVKFHDGCELNADLVVWNIARLLDEKTQGFHPVHYARHRVHTVNIDHAEKVDDGTVAIFTKTPDSLTPYNLSVWYMISKCAVEKVNFDYAQYARAPAGTGPYRFERVVPRERLELIKNAGYWNPKRVPKHDRLEPRHAGSAQRFVAVHPTSSSAFQSMTSSLTLNPTASSCALTSSFMGKGCIWPEPEVEMANVNITKQQWSPGGGNWGWYFNQEAEDLVA